MELSVSFHWNTSGTGQQNRVRGITAIVPTVEKAMCRIVI